MKILTLGSCRLQDGMRYYKANNFDSISEDIVIFPPYLHTVEQWTQMIKIFKYNLSYNKDCFYKSPSKIALKIIHPSKPGRMGRNVELDEIDKFVIEICGIRNYKNKEGIYLSPFYYKYKKHTSKDYRIVYSKDIYNQLKKLHKLINKKPLILVSNHNIYNKQSRTELIKILKEFARNTKNVKFINPTKLINKDELSKYLKDINHYTEHMQFLLAKEVLKQSKDLK